VESYNNNSTDGQMRAPGQAQEDGPIYGDAQKHAGGQIQSERHGSEQNLDNGHVYDDDGQINGHDDMMQQEVDRRGGDGEERGGRQIHREGHMHDGDGQINGDDDIQHDVGKHGGDNEKHSGGHMHDGHGQINGDDKVDGDGGVPGRGKMQGIGLKNAVMQKIPGGGMFGDGQAADDDRQTRGNEQVGSGDRQLHNDEQSQRGGPGHANKQSHTKAQIQAGGLKSAMRQIIPDAPVYDGQAQGGGDEQGSRSNQQPKASGAVSAFNDSIKKKAAKSASDSPSKKVWERVSQQAVGDTRVEQMKKMHTEKTVMSDEDASYYDSVNADDNIAVGKTNPEVVINGEDEDDY
ncbi:unnamed protein product, partial [Candidula unifasciata]